MNNNEIKNDVLAQAAAELVLREMSEIETQDVFGGDGTGGWVKVGMAQK